MFVDSPQECDGVQVLVSTKFVGDPLTIGAAVIEIKRGDDGVEMTVSLPDLKTFLVNTPFFGGLSARLWPI